MRKTKKKQKTSRKPTKNNIYIHIYIYIWILIGRSFSWISRDCQPGFFSLDYYDYYIRYLSIYIYIHVWIVDGTNHDIMKFSGSSPAPLQAPCCAWGCWNSSAAMRFERMDVLWAVGGVVFSTNMGPI